MQKGRLVISLLFLCHTLGCDDWIGVYGTIVSKNQIQSNCVIAALRDCIGDGKIEVVKQRKLPDDSKDALLLEVEYDVGTLEECKKRRCSRRLKGGLQLVRHKGRHAILVESTRLKAKDMSTSEREERQELVGRVTNAVVKKCNVIIVSSEERVVE